MRCDMLPLYKEALRCACERTWIISFPHSLLNTESGRLLAESETLKNKLRFEFHYKHCGIVKELEAAHAKSI